MTASRHPALSVPAGDGRLPALRRAAGRSRRPPRPGTPRVNADAALSVEFLKRVEDYVELHKKLEATLPPRPEGHARSRSTRTQRALAADRAGARPAPSRETSSRSDPRLLPPPDRAAPSPAPTARRSGTRSWRRIPARPAAGQRPLSRRRAADHDAAGGPAALPKLPEDLEYRFIGKRLILLDAHAHLIVDYIDNALPTRRVSCRCASTSPSRTALSSSAARRWLPRAAPPAPSRQRRRAGRAAGAGGAAAADAAEQGRLAQVRGASATSAPASAQQYELGEQMAQRARAVSRSS